MWDNLVNVPQGIDRKQSMIDFFDPYQIICHCLFSLRFHASPSYRGDERVQDEGQLHVCAALQPGLGLGRCRVDENCAGGNSALGRIIGPHPSRISILVSGKVASFYCWWRPTQWCRPLCWSTLSIQGSGLLSSVFIRCFKQASQISTLLNRPKALKKVVAKEVSSYLFENSQFSKWTHFFSYQWEKMTFVTEELVGETSTTGSVAGESSTLVNFIFKDGLCIWTKVLFKQQKWSWLVWSPWNILICLSET